jgi:lambda family phage portal protein
MQIFDKILSRFGYAKHAPRRSYDIAKIDRLTSSFQAPISTGDSELRYALATARARSRELERNNDYAKKFLQMCEVNVVGRAGFTLKNLSKDLNGKLDKRANDLIEWEWWRWGRKGNCTVDGKLSFLGVQKLFIRTVARDGEFLARKIRGFDNPWRFALQILEADVLDEGYNVESGNGRNKIRMGIEYDKWDRPVAYHLRKKHPGDGYMTIGGGATGEYLRVPAADIIHSYVPERSTQGRGVPWMHTAARRLNQVGEYEFAEVVAARLGASKMGFYQKTDPTGMGQFVPDETDSAGNPISHAEAGVFEKLPPGWEFKSFEPDHPTAQFGAFIKSTLRGVSAGLNVSYNSLANDLEGVNFSSMRVGAIDERDNWKNIQGWMIEDFLDQLFGDWLGMTLLTDRLNLPYSKFEKFNAPDWRGRTFDWVDPEKDINAEISAVKAKWKTERQVVLERFNMDLEDLYEQISEDEKLKAKYGIKSDFGEAVGKITQQQEEKPKEKPEEPEGTEEEPK